MTRARVLEIYVREIKPLSAAERLQLLALIADDLASQPTALDERPSHSIMELQGLGKEIWEGIDPNESVRALRGGRNLQP